MFSTLLSLISKQTGKKENKTNAAEILIGTIDQSTTATKFVVFDVRGQLIDKEIIPHDQITLHPGWLEHNAEQILVNTHLTIKNTITRLEEQGYKRANIKTIGITNQRETVVAWNKNTGKPYHNAIVWSDTRTHEICKRWLAKHENNSNIYSKITGLPINTYFSAFKIRWLIENVPEIQKELDENVIFGTMDSWVIWNLTNKLHLTDVTNASRTFLLNINTLQYEDKILNEFGIPSKCLPKVLSSAEDYGVIENGLLKGISIGACLGDQQAASLGHGLFQVGDSKNTYGTGCFLLVNIGNTPVYKEGGLLTTVLYKLGQDKPTYYAFEGSIEVGGSSINWARDNLGLFKTYDELQKLVESIDDSGDLCFVPAFSGLFSPYWREDAAGCILGLSLHTKREHILRALLEGIAYRTKDVIETVESCTGNKIESLKVDGGLTNSAFLVRFQADILQRKVLQTRVAESTCLGVAFAAGLTAQIYKDIEDIKKCIQIDRQIEPHIEFQEKQKQLYKKWQLAVEKSLKWKD
ncbi:hypothetical protein ABPG72_017452 [Tetrahymena utriculariae]